MTDPMTRALREELAAVRAHLQRVERQAQHDYEALAAEYRAVVQQQQARRTGHLLAAREPLALPARAAEPDPHCPF